MIVLDGLFPTISCSVKDFDQITFSDGIGGGGSCCHLQAIKFEWFAWGDWLADDGQRHH